MTLARFGRLPITQHTAFYWPADEVLSTSDLIDAGPNSVNLTNSSDVPLSARNYDVFASDGARSINATGYFSSDILTNEAELQAYATTWVGATVGVEAGISFWIQATSFAQTGDLIGFTNNTSGRRSPIKIHLAANRIRATFEYSSGTNSTTFIFNNIALTNGHAYFINLSRVAGATNTYRLWVYDFDADTISTQTHTTAEVAETNNSNRLRVGANQDDSVPLTNVSMWDIRLQTKACQDQFEHLHNVNLTANALGQQSPAQVKVYVQRANAVLWEDLDQLMVNTPLVNATLAGVSWGAGIEQPLAANIHVSRGVDRVSLAPEMTTSVYNNEHVSGSLPNQVFEYVPLLDAFKRVAIGVATEASPKLFHYQTRFMGRVDRVDWENEVITLACSANEGQAEQVQIKEELILAGYSGCQRFSQTSGNLAIRDIEGHQFVDGDRITLLGLVNNGDVLNGIETTVLDHDPSGKTNEILLVNPGGLTAGATDDGVITLAPLEQELRKLLAANPLPDGTILQIKIIGDPALDNDLDWAIAGYQQTRELLNQAIQNLVSQFGGVAKDIFDWETGRPVFTIMAPNRSEHIDGYLSTDEYNSFAAYGVNALEVRNDITVRIHDYEEPPDADGNFPVIAVQVEDTPSITRFGRRIGIVEGVRNIGTIADATYLANDIMADLSGGGIEAGLIMSFYRDVEFMDMLEIQPDGKVIDTAKTYAVLGYQHTIMGAESSTQLALAAEVTARHSYWLSIPGLQYSGPKQQVLITNIPDDQQKVGGSGGSKSGNKHAGKKGGAAQNVGEEVGGKKTGSAYGAKIALQFEQQLVLSSVGAQLSVALVSASAVTQGTLLKWG